MGRPFLKMNGLGNDFVVVETRTAPYEPTAEEVRAIADRQSGIGFDQLIVIGPSDRADAQVRFWNSDGEETTACGNGSRCVGWLLMQASGRDEATFETLGGLLLAENAGERLVMVDMGKPGLGWRDIPLAEEMDTRRIELQVGPIDAPLFDTPGCVSMGNPHVVFFIDDAETAPVREVGALIENHPLFPQGVNVGFAEIKAKDRIRLKVWERGAGQTKACGTGACASLVAASRRGLTGRRATVEMDGGELAIEWRATDDHVLMTGPIEVEFTGELP
jgi:diaminopimelate epimerase